jgi:hypothetical protein
MLIVDRPTDGHDQITRRGTVDLIITACIPINGPPHVSYPRPDDGGGKQDSRGDEPWPAKLIPTLPRPFSNSANLPNVEDIMRTRVHLLPGIDDSATLATVYSGRSARSLLRRVILVALTSDSPRSARKQHRHAPAMPTSPDLDHQRPRYPVDHTVPPIPLSLSLRCRAPGAQVLVKKGSEVLGG